MSLESQKNNSLVLSGQVSEGKSVGEEAESLLVSIDEKMIKAGTNRPNIIHANIFLTEMAEYDEFSLVWG